MDVPVSQQYRLGDRITHLLMLLLTAALLATGARLAWIGGDSPWFAGGSWPDKLLPTGRIPVCHAYLGLALLTVIMVYCVHLLLSGHLARLIALFTHSRYRPAKKLFYLCLLALLVMVSISGISLYLGLYEGADGHAFLKTVHHQGSALLVVLVAAHLVETIANRSSRVGAIFFGPTFPGFAAGRALAIAAAVGMVGLVVLVVCVQLPRTLVVPRIGDTARIDGLADDTIWSRLPVVTIPLASGINFTGGVTEVSVRAFHNSERIYVLLQWTDEEPSHNRQIVKTDSGWIERRSAYPDVFGETIYWDDGLALWFSRKAGCAGSCHLGGGGMGRHATGGDTVDIWHWRAVATNPIGQADDLWWGGDARNELRFDPQIIGGGGPGLNLDDRLRQPLFAPGMDPANVAIVPSNDTWSLFASHRDTFALGSTVPSVITVPFRDDRADVTARGAWADGLWTLELERDIRSQSPFDESFHGCLYLGIAAFSNADLKHAYHLRPIRLDIE